MPELPTAKAMPVAATAMFASIPRSSSHVRISIARLTVVFNGSVGFMTAHLVSATNQINSMWKR